jgi:2,4-diaminopentanoate dehydrogenase
LAYQVAQWGTGNVGTLALRGIIEHPDLELVGLLVHSPDKAGKDAGELAGLDPIGMTPTTDPAEIVKLGADCVSYMATGDLRPDDAVADMCQVLEAGTNVVSTSVVPLIYPPSAPARYREPLATACKAGGVSCFTSGIDPGFANDLVAFAFLGSIERVDSVRVMEILDYSTYLQADVLFDIMGFGKPLEELPLVLQPGVIGLAWGGTVSVLAAGLGAELDDVREVHERVPAARDYQTPLGAIAEGTTAGMRFEVQGIVGGEPRIVLEHVTRINEEVAPDWPKLPGQGGYRIDIEGNPGLHCQFHFEGEDGDHNTGGLTATAMRCLNAIPAVCEAEPGVLSVLDLPLVTGRGLLR